MIKEQSARKPFAMFALNLNDIPAEEQKVSSLGLQWKRVKGCYKNQIEDSYIVLFDDYAHMSREYGKVLMLAGNHNQESVMFVNTDRHCTLAFLNINTLQSIGTLRRSNPNEAIALGNWTLDGNQFWIVE